MPCRKHWIATLILLKDEVVMRQEATVITVGGSDYKKLVNLGGTASGWVGETDARSQTATSKLGLIEPFMGEIYGNPQATQKMLDDAFFNVEAWIKIASWQPNLPNRKKLLLPPAMVPRSRKGSCV